MSDFIKILERKNSLLFPYSHCEEHSDEAISQYIQEIASLALAMTEMTPFSGSDISISYKIKKICRYNIHRQ